LLRIELGRHKNYNGFLLLIQSKKLSLGGGWECGILLGFRRWSRS